MDSRRAAVLWLASAAAVLTILIQLVTRGPRPAEMAWQVACGLTCAVTAWAFRHGSARLRLTTQMSLVAVVLLSTPMVVLVEQKTVDLLSLVVTPMALTVMFLDARRVVLVVVLLGWVVNTLTLFALNWPLVDVLHSAAVMALVYGSGLFAVWEFNRLQALDAERTEERQRAAAQQLHTERLVTLGTLAARVAHEVNNPLAYVSANLQVLRDGDRDDDPERPQIWDEALEGVSRIAGIVADLKGLARDDSGDVTTASADPGPAIEQTLRIARLRSAGRVTFCADGLERLPHVTVAPGRLAQVLLNLVLNACDAVDEVPQPQVWVEGERRGDHVRIVVRDNGPGIPPSVAKRLFEPFVTSKPAGKGTGLGLALSRELVVAAGGTLVGENLARGACFTLTLPISSTITPLPQRPPASAQPAEVKHVA
jgi:C4-dicarboxylate-specific signal transduction histidine kinase